jgi:hypothetical protein
MNRREFLILAGTAAAVAAVTPRLLSGCPIPPPGWFCTRGAGHEGPCAAVAWKPRHPYRVGDVVTLSGFADPGYNGRWVVAEGQSLTRCK